jgi:hypothetical protein
MERDSRLWVGRHPAQQVNAERYGDVLARLADVLLAEGGESVVVPHFEPPEVAEFVLGLTLRLGQFVPGEVAVVEAGASGECHANAVALWRSGRGAISTGFALSDDGMWRAHSWLRESSGRLIETTEQRVAYFGLALDHEDADLFTFAFE